jgi:hypothetical protein
MSASQLLLNANNNLYVAELTWTKAACRNIKRVGAQWQIGNQESRTNAKANLVWERAVAPRMEEHGWQMFTSSSAVISLASKMAISS